MDTGGHLGGHWWTLGGLGGGLGGHLVDTWWTLGGHSLVDFHWWTFTGGHSLVDNSELLVRHIVDT